MKRRLMAVLMACVMTLSLLPISALATENSVKYGYYEQGNWVEGTVNQTLPEGVQSINKTARPTNNPNEYEIELEVIMEQTTETTPPGSAATVLVIDCSNSMEGKRLKAAKVAAISFMKAYSGLKNFDNNGSTVDTEDLNLGRYVSVVWFATTGGIQQDWVDVSNPANYNAAVEMINRLRIDGGTNLDAGLRLASVQLDATAVSQISYRNVIALTDGEPTYYLTADESGNPSINIGGTLYTVRGSGRSCDYDTFQKTKESANVLKEKTTLYTVCFGASKDKITDYDRPEYFFVEYYPEKITVGDYLKTKIATSDKTAYNADSADELYEVFAAISTSITTGLKSGVVTDTLPIGVSADGRFSPEWELKGAVGVEDGNKTVYTYTKTYKVTVDPKKVTVNEDNYTPLNGVTTLRVGENTQVYFPIPAVKVLITDPVVVTIKGNANRVEYDGNSHSVTGYTVESITCNGAPYAGYTESDFEFNGTASITETDAKTYNMGLNESYFTNTSSIFANVTFIVEDGYLEITPKPVTITVDPAEKSFGAPDPKFTGKEEGLVKDGDLGEISYSRTNTDEAVGTYEKVLDATYTANSNYTVKVVKGDFTIKTAASDAKLSAEGGEWEYDGKAHAASATVSDETFTIYYKVGDGEWTATAPSVTNVSDGLVTVSVKATKDGYNDLTCGNVTLKITPKPVTITVASMEKSFGAPDPAFTGKVEGLIGEDDLGEISYSRTNKDEAVGTYKEVLDATYTANENYSVTVTKGNFTIKTATSDAVLSAEGGEWEYDGTAHAARATVSDETFTIYYKVGDGEWTATAPSVTNVSDGLVTVSVKATKDGYNDLTCGNVTLKITPKPATVTANDMYVFSGSPVPNYSAQVEGTINDDKITYTISCDYTEAAGAGEFFDIIPSGEAEQGNYVVTYVNGTLEVRQLPNLAFNLGQYIQKDLRIIGSRAFTGVTYSATVTPVVNNELGKAMTITVSYGSGESGLKPFVGELGFTERGSYRYEVKEIIPSGAMGYDTSVYYLTVDVGLNDDELVVDKVTKTLAGGSEDPSEGAIVFCNTYNTGTIYVPVVKPALNRDDHYAYVVGYPDGMVRPSGNITRAEAATIFFRLLTDDSRNQFWMTTNAYSDVNRGDWFNNAVSTLSNAGIISGYPDGTFRPNAPITRAEMSKIIALFAKLNKSEDRFNDIAGHWAEAYIKLAAGNGWIAGYPDGSFKPQQNITRAETMTMINRVLERVPSVESHLLPYNAMLTFPDCQSGQWFYIAVQEATNSHTYERAASEKNGDEQWIALRANRDWTQFQN